MSANGSEHDDDRGLSDAAAGAARPLPQGNATSGRQVADVVAACLLGVVQLALYCGSFMFLGLMVMGTDSCAYEACGDPAWLNRALYLEGYGGAALLLIAGGSTLYRIFRNLLAWFVPLIGCLAQIGLGLACWTMEMKAGPLGR